VLALSAVVALLALAPIASAEGEPDTGAFNSFSLKGSNGYRILVWAGSKKGYRHGEVFVIAYGKQGSVAYSAPATVTDIRVDADLGAIGEIDVTFQPSGEREVEHSVCGHSQRLTYDKGTYVGTIDLRGEEGYTRVRAESVPYNPGPFIDIGCDGSWSGELLGHGLPGARLRARAKFGEGETIELQANQNRPGARVKIGVSTEERRDRVRISREASFTYPAGALDFTPNLRSAALAPPAPFSGSALFRRNATPANRWTGDLEVDLPGRSNVSLAGARFDAGLVHADYTE